MKKILFFCCMACLAACSTPTTNTPGTDSTAQTVIKDSNTVAVSDPATVTPIDTVAPASDLGEATTDKTVNNKTEATGKQSTGKLANPNIDLNAKRFTVSGQLLWTASYCGGAAPRQDILDELARPKPRAQQALIVRSGVSNALGTALVTRTTTDAQGKFSFSLIPGDYCICLAEKENARTKEFRNTKAIEINEPCDTKWLKTCDIVFKLRDKGTTNLSTTFHQNCDVPSLSPCISYTGPRRP